MIKGDRPLTPIRLRPLTRRYKSYQNKLWDCIQEHDEDIPPASTTTSSAVEPSSTTSHIQPVDLIYLLQLKSYCEGMCDQIIRASSDRLQQLSYARLSYIAINDSNQVTIEINKPSSQSSTLGEDLDHHLPDVTTSDYHNRTSDSCVLFPRPTLTATPLHYSRPTPNPSDTSTEVNTMISTRSLK